MQSSLQAGATADGSSGGCFGVPGCSAAVFVRGAIVAWAVLTPATRRHERCGLPGLRFRPGRLTRDTPTTSADNHRGSGPCTPCWIPPTAPPVSEAPPTGEPGDAALPRSSPSTVQLRAAGPRHRGYLRPPRRLRQSNGGRSLAFFTFTRHGTLRSFAAWRTAVVATTSCRLDSNASSDWALTPLSATNWREMPLTGRQAAQGSASMGHPWAKIVLRRATSVSCWARQRIHVSRPAVEGATASFSPGATPPTDRWTVPPDFRRRRHRTADARNVGHPGRSPGTA